MQKWINMHRNNNNNNNRLMIYQKFFKWLYHPRPVDKGAPSARPHKLLVLKLGDVKIK
jgi:hypothetical protein